MALPLLPIIGMLLNSRNGKDKNDLYQMGMNKTGSKMGNAINGVSSAGQAAAGTGGAKGQGSTLGNVMAIGNLISSLRSSKDTRKPYQMQYRGGR